MTVNSNEWIDDIVQRLGVVYPTSRRRYTPDPLDVSTIEADIGGRIGSDLLYFMSRYGDSMLGGKGAQVCVRVNSDECLDDMVCPSDFFSLSLRSSNSATEVYRIARTPSGILPIAADAGANLICVDISKPDGCVFYLFREATTPDWRVATISGSFRGFILNLERIPR